MYNSSMILYQIRMNMTNISNDLLYNESNNTSTNNYLNQSIINIINMNNTYTKIENFIANSTKYITDTNYDIKYLTNIVIYTTKYLIMSMRNLTMIPLMLTRRI